MGNGASAGTPTDATGRKLQQNFSLYGNTDSRAEATFKTVDVDGSGGIDKSEFALAAKAVGLSVEDKELDAVFKEYDVDKNGTIDQAEFLKFFREKQLAFYDEDAAAVDKLSAEGLKSLIPYIGPAEASRGFRKAFLVLAKNPASAKAALSATNPMQPLHLLLALDAPVSSAVGTKDKAKQGALARAKNASQEAASAAAIPLIVAVCAASPESAQVRVGVGKEDAPDGKLPLCIALERKWPAEVVAALVKAYPEGATTIDSVKMKKGVAVPGTLKAGRWARKVAEEGKLGADVVSLLAMPKKKGKEVEWLTQEQVDAETAKGKK